MRLPGAKAIVAYQQKILLVLRDNDPQIAFPNTWNLPGGGLEINESPEVAMRRELKEEVNLAPVTLIPIGITTYSDKSVVHRFFCSLTNDEYANIKLLSEGQRLGWFTLEEVQTLLPNKLSPYIDIYFKTFITDLEQLLHGQLKVQHENKTLYLP